MLAQVQTATFQSFSQGVFASLVVQRIHAVAMG